MPFQYSQVVAFICKTASITSLSASSYSTQPNHFLATDNSLFSSGNDSESVESKENRTSAPKTNAASKQVPAGAGVGGGGLFDDEDEDDDFFSGKSLNKSESGKRVRTWHSATVQVWVGCCLPSNHCVLVVVFFFSFFFSAGQEKPKPKKAIDLFDDDDEDGDIFSAKYSVPTPAQSKKEGVEEQVKYPEKKVNINRNLRLKMIAVETLVFGKLNLLNFG